MTAVQWQKIKEITAGALDLEPAHRAGYVENACGDDSFVYQEVLQLICREESQGGEFLNHPLANLHDVFGGGAAGGLVFEPGDILANRFEILQFLNRGGMGEVYSAKDRELREKVALKTIHPAIANSPEVIDRFKQEVRQTRSIAHPNVCRVYDLFCHETPDGISVWFLTMELLEGRPLAETSEPLRMKRALPLIREMVSALSAAHNKGIVHRDFKPKNVMLEPAGHDSYRAVVTDFGLAANVDSQTRDTAGTPAYIAPEQARGEAVGPAADQFSLGMVIAEMLTGEIPPLDRTSPEKAKKQLHVWFSGLPGNVLKPSVRAALTRALAFSPEDRFPHVSDLLAALDGGKQRKRWRALGAAAAIAATLLLVFAWPEESGEQLDGLRLLTSQTDWSATPSLSADGKWVAYASNRDNEENVDIWLDSPLGGQARRLTANPGEDTAPSISPDGSALVFRSESNGGGVDFIRNDGSGGRLLAAGGRDPVFSPDGRLVAYWTGDPNDSVPSGQIYVIPAEGGPARQIAPDFLAARYPLWSPDSKHVLFEGCRTNDPPFPACNEWWLADLKGGGPVNTGAFAALRAQGVEVYWHQKAWYGSRVLLGGRGGLADSLWAVNIPEESGRISGRPWRLTTGDTREIEPALAPSGSVAFARISGSIHLWRLQLGAPAEPPRAAKLTNAAFGECCPAATRDGRWLYFTRRIHEVKELFRKDIASGAESVVLTSPEEKSSPAPNENGTKVAFEVARAKGTAIDLLVEGEPARTLCADCSHPTSWFGDNAIFYTSAAGRLAILDTSSGVSRNVPFEGVGPALGEADWSPDNQYILATVSSSEGAKQICAVRFPKWAASPTGPWTVLTPEGQWTERPRWSKDGKIFYYLSNRDGHLCVWGQRFTPGSVRPSEPFPVMHYHEYPRFSPKRIMPVSRGFSVADGSLYLNVGEGIETIWTGKLKTPSLIANLRDRLFSWLIR